MELGTGIGNHNDLFTQSHNIIPMRCIFAQPVLLFKSNLCSGNHRASLASDKFHYDMTFEKKDVFPRQTVGIYFAGPSWIYFTFSHHLLMLIK